MNNFDFVYNSLINSETLNESLIDIPRNSLDPAVFTFPDGHLPVMNTAIKSQIIADIQKIEDVLIVNKFFVIGSILTPQYNPRTDIDVNVEVDEQVMRNLSQEHLMSLIKLLNGKLAVGTQHPINYFLVPGEYDLDKTDAAYDVANEVWIKEPEQIDISVNEYMNRFQTAVLNLDANTGELRRDLMDLDEINEISADHVKGIKQLASQKLNEIEDNVLNIISSLKNTKALRRIAFERSMSPSEIREFGHKNRLPENVIYKLLEKYHYFNLLKRLKEALGEDGELSPSEVDDVKQAGKEFWNEAF
jgi:predicted nucleotidyltransferase